MKLKKKNQKIDHTKKQSNKTVILKPKKTTKPTNANANQTNPTRPTDRVPTVQTRLVPAYQYHKRARSHEWKI